MDNTELDKLEANIRRAIVAIQKLQGENHRLKQENERLSNRLREYEHIIQESKIQRQADGEAVDRFAGQQEKEGKIKQKIQQMLEKLETFQQLSSSD